MKLRSRGPGRARGREKRELNGPKLLRQEPLCVKGRGLPFERGQAGLGEGHTRIVLKGGVLLHNGVEIIPVEGSDPALNIIPAAKNGDTVQIKYLSARPAAGVATANLMIGTTPVQFKITTKDYLYDFTFKGSNYGVHDGKTIKFIIFNASNENIASDSTAVGDGVFSFPKQIGILNPNATYWMDFYAEYDSADSTACELASGLYAGDHSWRVDVPIDNGHVVLDIPHGPFVTDACASFP